MDLDAALEKLKLAGDAAAGQEFEYAFPSSSEDQGDREGLDDFEADSLNGSRYRTEAATRTATAIQDEEGHSMSDTILRVASGQDEDINELAAALRTQFREHVLRTAVDSVVNMKMRMLSDAEAAHARAESVRAAEAAAAAAREELLLQETRRLQAALEAEQAKRGAMAGKLGTLQLGVLQRARLSCAYQAWRDETASRRERIRRVMQGFQRTQAALEKRAFLWWRNAARREGVARARAEAAAQLKAVTSKIVARYEATLAAMANDLAAAQASADRERARGTKLEDDLRRALLRGMTVMNMEALGVFHDNRASPARAQGGTARGAAAAPTPCCRGTHPAPPCS
eukprot:TRINITY_DN31188_c0_g1_i1.p2 TRINITY_DN31188_c0_g1~~TRINITY_DN31188_c0_g1_i1.p2  ORF type:complete len:387 (-),score=96.09 TRINITY_DN31188_c0_g1_i1:1024-2052(-)